MIEKLKDKLKNQDTKSVVINIVCSFGIKGVSMFIGLFTTPSYIRYFNDNEVMGIWFTLLSVLAWILNCDMGIGNGLRNKLVPALKSKDKDEPRRYVSSCYVFSFVVAAVVMIVLIAVSGFVNWNKIFNISEKSLDSQVLTTALAILLLSVCVQLILRLITSILYALQKAFIPSLLNLVTNIVMLLFAVIATKMHCNGSIINMAIAYFAAVNVPLIIATFYVFLVSNRNLMPSFSLCKKEYAFSTLKIGGAFLWIQLMAMILNSTNSYFVTLFVGNTAAVEFNIYNKIFTLIGTFVTLGSTPIWSAATKAQAENNYGWLYSLFKKFTGLSLLAIVGEFVLVLPLQLVFNVWLGDTSIPVNYGYAVVFAIFGSVMIWSSAITSFVNGLGELKLQSIFVTLGAVIDVVLTYYLAKITQNFTAIVIANICAYLPYLLVQTVWLLRYFKKVTKKGGRRKL